jgi:hypothetical protein
MSAIDTHSSELKPTTEHQPGEEQKPMIWTKVLAHIQPHNCSLRLQKDTITSTIKIYKRELSKATERN